MIRVSGDICRAYVVELDLTEEAFDALSEEEQTVLIIGNLGIKCLAQEEAVEIHDIDEI